MQKCEFARGPFPDDGVVSASHTHIPLIYTKALLAVLQREHHSLLFVQLPKAVVFVCVEHHPQLFSWLCDSQCTVRPARFAPIKRDTLDACVCLANSHRRHKRELVIHKATVIIILLTVHGATLPCELRPICDILAIRHRCNHATALVDTRVGSACVGKISNQTHRTYGRRGEGSVHVRPIKGNGSDHLQLLRQGGRKQAAFLFIVPCSHKVQQTIRVQQGVGNRLIQSSLHVSRSNTKHAVAVSHPNVERM
ncbi:hypothetical protein TCSYLVIO_008705, partial [Trypanosoma cruzi]